MGIVIDKISGQVFLFDTSGGGGTGTTSPYLEVNTFSQLPDPTINNGKIYVVRQSTGAYVTARKEAGLYYSNGTTWDRLGDIPSFFSSNNFRLYDSTDNTKQVQVVLSGNTTNTTHKITLRNSDGVIAYLSDLTGATSTTYHAIQLIDLVGGINVNNILPSPIQWTNVQFSGDSLTYTGASRIYIQSTGNYQITYNLILKNGNSINKTIGTVVKLNGNTDITPLSVSTFIDGGVTKAGSNNVANYKRALSAGDYVELYAFRIGNTGSVTTVPAASWIHIMKI